MALKEGEVCKCPEKAWGKKGRQGNDIPSHDTGTSDSDARRPHCCETTQR